MTLGRQIVHECHMFNHPLPCTCTPRAFELIYLADHDRHLETEARLRVGFGAGFTRSKNAIINVGLLRCVVDGPECQNWVAEALLEEPRWQIKGNCDQVQNPATSILVYQIMIP